MKFGSVINYLQSYLSVLTLNPRYLEQYTL